MTDDFTKPYIADLAKLKADVETLKNAPKDWLPPMTREEFNIVSAARRWGLEIAKMTVLENAPEKPSRELDDAMQDLVAAIGADREARMTPAGATSSVKAKPVGYEIGGKFHKIKG